MFMDLTALPTQKTDYNHDQHLSSAFSSPAEMQAQPFNTSDNKTINPNAIILADALTDATISWRIHNCKVSKKIVMQDLPLPFLYHYDSLEESVKALHPLTPALLSQFNTPMSTADAAKAIGIAGDVLTSPWHVKVIGSLVVYSEVLQLAVRLHWTNTAKSTQQLYTKSAEDALTAAFKEWQFFGRIDVLCKNDKQALISIDEQAVEDEPLLTIHANADYQQLPATHALTVIAKLEADKDKLPWFETAILERLE